MLTDQDKDAERDARWWLLEPAGHRAFLSMQPRPKTTEFMGQQVEVIYAPDPPPGVWICDFCGDDIVWITEEASYWIPMFDSNALCWSCMRSCMTTAEQAVTPLSPVREFKPSTWAGKWCGCPACAMYLDRRLALLEEQGLA